jgi:6-pyruvoyltetrahydropterin/6-carboxytetrahydropterin synthase
MISAVRYHDISCGHRVYGHESKCAHLHGHNYRVHFGVTTSELDRVGRVIDFSVIKDKLCMWLEDNWDHKFLVWQEDPWAADLAIMDPTVVSLPFNPTAEKMADYLMRFVAPVQLMDTGVVCTMVKVEETRKCSAFVTSDAGQLEELYRLVEESARRKVSQDAPR